MPRKTTVKGFRFANSLWQAMDEEAAFQGMSRNLYVEVAIKEAISASRLARGVSPIIEEATGPPAPNMAGQE